MYHHDDAHSIRCRRLAEMRRAGYHGAAYLRGRPAYDYLPPRARWVLDRSLPQPGAAPSAGPVGHGVSFG